MGDERKSQAVEPHRSTSEGLQELRNELATARERLIEAEADLAKEQAEVNAFRMHCRLKLDAWIERLMKLQAEKQSLLTEVRLRSQEQTEDGFSDPDAFWRTDSTVEHRAEEELILPTDVPRDRAAEKRLYRQLARRFHPDLGVTAVEIAYRTDMMAAVNRAYESSDIQSLYDLADQLDPKRAKDLADIPSLAERKLRTRIVRLRQRKRKAGRRMAALRRENTARLYRKAQRLDRNDVNWWEIVRLEIETFCVRLERDILALQKILDKLEPLSEEAGPAQEDMAND